MSHQPQNHEAPSKPDNGRYLRPVIITADKHFHATLSTALPDLQEQCVHLSSLRHMSVLRETYGDSLLLFIDIDSYSTASLISFMKRHKASSEIRVIGLSECSELETVIRYLKSGIGGYFLKQEISAELVVQSIMTVAGSGFPMSPGITQKIIQTLIRPKDNYISLLSTKEQQILNRLMNGSSYKLAAKELNISLETVRYHIKRIYKKLDVNSKGEIIAKMLKNKNALQV